MASLSQLLAQVRQRESSNDYTAQNRTSSASGAYGYIDATWRTEATRAGYGQYAGLHAREAPPQVQDAVAGYSATHNDPNSTYLWAASAPAGGYPYVGALGNDAITVPGGVAVNDITISGDPTAAGDASVTRTLDGTPAAGSGDGTLTLDGSPAVAGGTSSGSSGSSGGGLAYGGKLAAAATTVPDAIVKAGNAIDGGVSSVGATLGGYVNSAIAAGEALFLRGGVMFLAVIMLLAAAWLMLPSAKSALSKVR